MKGDRIELSPKAKALIDQLAAKSGMRQRVFLSRLVEWFVSQPEVLFPVLIAQILPEMQAEYAQVANQEAIKPLLTR